MPEIVEGLVGHTTGGCAAAPPPPHPAFVVLELEGRCQAVRIAENGGGVTVLDPVVFGLGAVGVPGEPTRLTEMRELVAASGHQLVDVRLVSGVPEQDVTRRVEGPVQ